MRGSWLGQKDSSGGRKSERAASSSPTEASQTTSYALALPAPLAAGRLLAAPGRPSGGPDDRAPRVGTGLLLCRRRPARREDRCVPSSSVLARLPRERRADLSRDPGFYFAVQAGGDFLIDFIIQCVPPRSRREEGGRSVTHPVERGAESLPSVASLTSSLASPRLPSACMRERPPLLLRCHVVL